VSLCIGLPRDHGVQAVGGTLLASPDRAKRRVLLGEQRLEARRRGHAGLELLAPRGRERAVRERGKLGELLAVPSLVR
jgi:hypothetical protein